NRKDIWQLLEEVTDPEIPVLTIVDLGIAREVTVSGDEVTVKITPTYSGCPAMNVIEDDIAKKLRLNGITNFTIKKDFSEAWTTDWMSDDGKQKLKEYGIAPPGKTNPDDHFLNSLHDQTTACPYCDSTNTKLQSEF